MTMLPDAPSRFETTVYERILKSDRYKAYQDAFRVATGLPLRLVCADTTKWCLDEEGVNRSPFCEQLNLCAVVCQACIDTNRQLMKDAEVQGPSTCECFAGLTATAVPVRLGASLVGYLKTGQVFSKPPEEDRFRATLNLLGRKSLTKSQVDSLKKTWMETRSVAPERYDGMVLLLKSFAEQLSLHAESLAIIEEGSEPVAIAKARKFIHANLDQPLPLGTVARQAGLSESHFCRLFKEATGLTLTDYVNRCRIEWATRELLRPDARVSEIAFLVGYQSLSQFNRSFARIVGEAPTSYRRSKLERAAS